MATKPRRSRDSASPRTASRSVSAARGRREEPTSGRWRACAPPLAAPRRRDPAPPTPPSRRGGATRGRGLGRLVGPGSGSRPDPAAGAGRGRERPAGLGGVRGTFIIPEYRRNPGGGRGVPAGRRLGERARGLSIAGVTTARTTGRGVVPTGGLSAGAARTRRGTRRRDFLPGRARGVRGRVRRGADVEARRGGTPRRPRRRSPPRRRALDASAPARTPYPGRTRGSARPRRRAAPPPRSRARSRGPAPRAAEGASPRRAS